MKIRIIAVGICLVGVPFLTEARHTDRIDTSDLDDEKVETFSIPVLFGVAYNDLVPDYGDPRSGGRVHEGQDMRAPIGTPIVSPTEAVVLRTGTGVSSGKYVYTRNPGGETFRYMHLDSIADIKRGDELDVGELIGTVGDTGNAPVGVYHLHFETRDENNQAQDPYLRLTDGFSLQEKIAFLPGILRAIEDDEAEYAEFMVTTFPDAFTEAMEDEYRMPDVIEDALADNGALTRQTLLEQLDEVIDMIPDVLSERLAVGDTGTEVSLLQTFLLFRVEGPARDRLASAGATGYFGPITSAALMEYQRTQKIAETGVYDSSTQTALAK